MPKFTCYGSIAYEVYTDVDAESKDEAIALAKEKVRNAPLLYDQTMRLTMVESVDIFDAEIEDE